MSLTHNIETIQDELKSLKDSVEWAQEAQEGSGKIDLKKFLFDIHNRITYIENQL